MENYTVLPISFVVTGKRENETTDINSILREYFENETTDINSILREYSP